MVHARGPESGLGYTSLGRPRLRAEKIDRLQCVLYRT